MFTSVNQNNIHTCFCLIIRSYQSTTTRPSPLFSSKRQDSETQLLVAHQQHIHNIHSHRKMHDDDAQTRMRGRPFGFCDDSYIKKALISELKMHLILFPIKCISENLTHILI